MNVPFSKAPWLLMGGAAALVMLVIALELLPQSPEIADAEAAEITRTCRSRAERESCYAKGFGDLTGRTNLERAFRALASLQAADPQARGCHFIAHAIGTAETEKDAARWREVMDRAPDACTYGAMHGALEVHLAEVSGGLTPEVIRETCAGARRGDCTHIVGHLLLVETKRNIPGALKLCEALPEERNQRYLCFLGVFMEEETAQNLVAHGLADRSALDWPARLPELETLCRSYTGRYGQACWEEIVHAAAAKFGNDPATTFGFCTRHPDPLAQARCIRHGIGVVASAQPFSFRLDALGPICESLPPRSPVGPAECQAELIGSFLSTVPDEGPHAQRYCATLAPKLQPTCFGAARGTLSALNRLTPERWNALCAEVNPASRGACLDASSRSVAAPLGND